MKENNYLANEEGVSLKDHSIAVMNETERMCRELGIDEVTTNVAKAAALLHDIGKTASSFQSYIKGRIDGTADELSEEEKEERQARHNVIGAFFARKFINVEIDDLDRTIAKNVLINAIEFHHYPYSISTFLSDVYTEEEFNYTIEYISELIRVSGMNSILSVNTKGFDYGDENEIKRSKKNTVIDLTEGSAVNTKSLSIYDIVFNIVRYVDYQISSGSKAEIKSLRSFNEPFIPEGFDAERWNKQVEMAKKASDSHISLIDAPMGFGKTLTSLFYIRNLGKKAYWILPDNALSEATYRQVSDLVEKCGFGYKVSLLLTGTYVNGEDGSDADIVITNIDNFTSGYFKNTWKTITKDRMACTCVFDEFHKYFQNSPLLPAFRATIKMRERIQNVNTLLMSATPIEELMKGVDFNVVSVDRSDFYNKKVTLRYVSEKDLETEIPDFRDMDILSIYNSVEKSQEKYESLGYNLNIHKRFTEKDIKEKIGFILDRKGRGKNGPESVSATNIIGTGVDCSFGKLVCYNPTPEDIIQSGGRINRYDCDAVSEYNVIESGKGEDRAIYSCDSGKERYWFFIKKWMEHLKSRVPDGATVTVKDLMDIRNEFYSDQKNRTNIINPVMTEWYDKGFEILSDIKFKEGNRPSTEKSEESYIVNGPSLRGESDNIYISVKDDEGNMTEPFVANCKWFKGAGFTLGNQNVRNIVEKTLKFIRSNKDIKIKYGMSTKDETKAFDIMKSRALCSSTPFIIRTDYSYNKNIGFYKK